MFKVLFLLLIQKHVNYFLGFKDIGFKGIATINCGLYSLLLLCSLHDFLLNSTLGDKTENRNWLCLTNTMSTILSLCINSRVPVIIIEDNSVCSSQVHTETTCSG